MGIGAEHVDAKGGVDNAGYGEFEGQFGFADTLAARLAMSGAVHPDADSPTGEAVATLGVTYAIDVARIIPFAELGAQVANLSGGGTTVDGTRLGLEGGIGGEYLLSDAWAIALVARGAVLPIKLGGDEGPKSRISLGIRIGVIF